MKKISFIILWLCVFSYGKNIYATFIVEGKQSASLAFNATGVIEKINVDVGSIVRKDEILATMQNRDMIAALQINKTSLKYAKKDYDRQQKVRNIIDQSRMDAFAYKYENAKAQLAYQQAILDKTILKAPFDGIITYRNVEIGDTVNGMTLKTIFKIESLKARKLILTVDQKYWKDIKAGNRFSYRLDGSDTLYEGVVTKIYPTIDPKSRKLTVEVAAEGIPIGLFGTGNIKTSDKDVE